MGSGSPSKFEKCVRPRCICAASAFIFATNGVSPGPYALARTYAASQPEGSSMASSSCWTVSRSPACSPALLASHRWVYDTAAAGTVSTWPRCPARSTTSAVMTLVMLPIGRLVSRPRLHSSAPVAAFSSAAPFAWTAGGAPARRAAETAAAGGRCAETAAAGRYAAADAAKGQAGTAPPIRTPAAAAPRARRPGTRIVLPRRRCGGRQPEPVMVVEPEHRGSGQRDRQPGTTRAPGGPSCRRTGGPSCRRAAGPLCQPAAGVLSAVWAMTECTFAIPGI